MAMARGSLWDELGRDREKRRRSEVAWLRAEAQIRKDDRQSTAGSAQVRRRGSVRSGMRRQSGGRPNWMHVWRS